jgi:hypothetical protein
MATEVNRKVQTEKIRFSGKKKPAYIIAEEFRSYLREKNYLTMLPNMRTGYMAYGGVYLDVSNMNWKWVDLKELERMHNAIRRRVQKAMRDINYDLVKQIGMEYQTLIYASGAVASGDMVSEGIGWDIKQDPSNPAQFTIRMLVPYWLYQEEGFDMSRWQGKSHMLPSAVKKKIWEWGVAKGIVQRLIGPYREEGRKSGSGRLYRSVRISTPLQRQRLYTYAQQEDYEDVALSEFSKAEQRALNKLVRIVVSSNSNVDNGRLFLHTAFNNVMRDRELVMDIVHKWLKEYRIITK